jgi:hypothetical protein
VYDTKIVERIQKLLRLRDNAGTQAEAENAAAKVQELLFKHNLEMSEVQSHVPDDEKSKIERQFFTTDEGKNESTWVQQLYSAIARYNFCMIVIHKQGYRQHQSPQIAILGKPENIAVVGYTCDWLVPRIRKMSGEAFREYTGYEKKGKFTRGFLVGCVAGIQHKLHKEWQALQDSAVSTALVVVNTQELEQAKTEMYGRLSQGRRTSLSSQAGYQSGYSAGSTMSFQKGVESGQRGGRLSSG